MIYAQANESVLWPTTPSVVIASEVEIIPPSRGRGKNYIGRVKYQYSAEAVVAKSPVTVYYSPEKPRGALLEPGFNKGALFLPFALGGICILFWCQGLNKACLIPVSLKKYIRYYPTKYLALPMLKH